MILYSQRDPAYSKLKLGLTTVGADGCVVTSISTLFQVDPKVILALPKVINSRGECDIKRCVELLGGKLRYRGTNRPEGWCLAKTYHYKKQGVPTHFFLFNEGAMIDPLLHPTQRLENIYTIAEYIKIDNIKLDFTLSDLQERLEKAEKALKSGRLSGLRESGVLNFIKRGKKILSTFFS